MAKVIGLTGGIACGKSAVAALLRQRGHPVIDADQVARQVVAPGTEGLAAIVERFGEELLNADGSLDRTALGRIVFGDSTARRDLEAITHPRIGQRSGELMRDAALAGAERVFYEAALLVETGRHRQFDSLWVVAAPVELQIERVMARDGLSVDEAKERIDAQMPVADKVAVADVVIDNAGEMGALAEAVDDALSSEEEE